MKGGGYCNPLCSRNFITTDASLTPPRFQTLYGHQTGSPRTAVPDLECSGVVYEIKCGHCPKVYTEGTGQALAEHKQANTVLSIIVYLLMLMCTKLWSMTSFRATVGISQQIHLEL